MRRGLMLVSCILMCACASAGTFGAARAQPATQTIGSRDLGGSIRVATSTAPDVTTLPYAIDQVWRALPAAFDSLSIPIAHSDPDTHVLGNDRFKIRQRLGKTSLSRFFDCGETQIGANADSYEVMLTVRMQLQAAGAASTKVATIVEALARPITFNQAYSRCQTRGALESRLIAQLRARLSL